MHKVIFTETQKFRQWWLWAILLIALIAPIAGMFYQSNEDDLLTKLLLSCIPVTVLLLMFVMRLETTISDHSIKIYFFPFVKKEWLWKDLKMARVIDYGFIGGWGIRIWTGYGTVYNVRGSKGLHIKTTDKEYVIGTQKEKELRDCISHLLK